MGNCPSCGNFISFPDTACKLRVSDKGAKCVWIARPCFKELVAKIKKEKK